MVSDIFIVFCNSWLRSRVLFEEGHLCVKGAIPLLWENLIHYKSLIRNQVLLKFCFSKRAYIHLKIFCLAGWALLHVKRVEGRGTTFRVESEHQSKKLMAESLANRERMSSSSTCGAGPDHLQAENLTIID